MLHSTRVPAPSGDAETVGTWTAKQRRYFALQGTTLYYADKEGQDMKKHMEIAGVEPVERDDPFRIEVRLAGGDGETEPASPSWQKEPSAAVGAGEGAASPGSKSVVRDDNRHV